MLRQAAHMVTLLLLVSHFIVGVVGDDAPSLISASWSTIACSAASCPPNLPWDPTLGAIQLTLQGSLFGSAPGSAGRVDIAAPAPSPSPVDIPADLPEALQLFSENPEFDFARNGNGCLAPSDTGSATYSFEVCPYSTSFIRARGGGPRLASLGAFAGVVRRANVVCDSSVLQVSGLLFQGGDVCGSGTLSAQVNFVCIRTADPWADRFLANASVNAATGSADGCSWQLDVPLAVACDDTLCSAIPNPSPNAVPTPAPFSFTSGFVASWTPSSIIVLVQPTAGTTPPGLRGVRVRRYDGALSGLVLPLRAPLPPSASPIPVPFPASLTVLGVAPSGGLSFLPTDPAPSPPCDDTTFSSPVVVSLAGVQPGDLEGFGACFEITFPRSPLLFESDCLYGAPLGANASVTRVPANGRLDLVLPCAPRLLEGFPTPHAATFTVASRYRAVPDGPLITRRAAVCAAGACTWLFWGPTGPPAAPAASNTLSGPALYGVIGGGLSLVVLLAVGIGAYCWIKRKASALPPPLPKAAWGAQGVSIEMNPTAGLGASLKGESVAEWSPK